MRLPRVKIKVGRKTIVKHENQTSYQEFKHERAMVTFSFEARG